MLTIRDVHEREVPASAANVGTLVDGLSSESDRLWPASVWPRMRLDRPLGVGARGGHGPIRYEVVGYEPGRRVKFRFTAPRGFNGEHWFEVESVDGDHSRIRHVLEMRASGGALVSWPVLFRPLHDALIEDALDMAERAMGAEPSARRWSTWVKTLRWLLGRR